MCECVEKRHAEAQNAGPGLEFPAVPMDTENRS